MTTEPTLCLNKALDPKDLEHPDLAQWLPTVDEFFKKDSPQHRYRRWEYSLALEAYARWFASRADRRTAPLRLLDVGGAGSPFWRMLVKPPIVVDPQIGCSIAEYLEHDGRSAHAVFCISVIEHVEDLETFLYHLACVVAPGGLLVLTFDACGCAGVHDAGDPHHYNWMRQQSFTQQHTRQVLNTLVVQHHFTLLGLFNPHWFGEVIHDYSFRSLVLVKRRVR